MRDKFILTVYNEIIFDAKKIGEEAVVRKSRLMWNPINTQFQSSLVQKLQLASIDLQDMMVDLDSLTEIEDESLFSLERFPDRSYEKDYHA